MKRIFCVSLLLFVFFFSTIASADRGARRKITPSVDFTDFYNTSAALVIGNGDYKNGWSHLPGALRDAGDVAAALKDHGFTVVLKKNLTKNQFSRVLLRFIQQYGRDQNNRLLFYYSGHGHTETLATGDQAGYLVMVDAGDPYEDPVSFEMGSIPMQDLLTRAKMIHSKHVLFLFDSCFSGNILNSRGNPAPRYVSDATRKPVRQFITAGSAEEPVPDQSIFKTLFLDMLNGEREEPFPDGYLTGEELGMYLKQNLPSYNGKQHPQYGKINDPRLDKGDFVFFLKKKEPLPIKEQQLAPLRPATLTVRTIPQNARVQILHIKPKYRAGMALAAGTYTLEVSAPDYQSQQRQVKMVRGEALVEDFILKPEVLPSLAQGSAGEGGGVHSQRDTASPVLPSSAILSVESSPQGATVYLGKRKLGVTPLTVSDLPGGKHSLLIQKRYYVDLKREVELAPDEVVKRDYVLEKGRGNLTLLSTPSGSVIWVDNKKLKDSSPVTIHGLEAGKHTVLIHKDRYYDSEQELVVRHGKTTKLDVNLSGGNLVQWKGKWMSPLEAEQIKKESLGQLTIHASPADAVVKILNIVPQYQDNQDKIKLEAGRYHLQVSKPGYEKSDQWVSLVTGQDLQLDVSLNKEDKSRMIEPAIGMEFVLVKGGCYQMGDIFGEGRDREKPVHEVCVDDFYMGKYEVTQGEWQKIMGSNPSEFKNGDRYPVENVSWKDITEDFLPKLNRRSGKSYRLPTEAEWEYAVREGGKKVRFGNGKDIADPREINFDGSADYKKPYSRMGVYREKTAEVGNFTANSLGLYDMSGNVWEWCSDWYGENYYDSSPRNNPEGLDSGSSRVLRGGSWRNSPRYTRASFRISLSPEDSDNILGFRLVLPVH